MDARAVLRAWLNRPALRRIATLQLSNSFSVRGQKYRYFYHPYNATWNNERAVELPIAWAAVQDAGQGRILEVGNVLSHYFRVHHDIVDKYERNEGVINRDVLDFEVQHPYELIVCISTLEHVGWDEEERDASKIGRAITHLEAMLAPGGRLLATLPLGYNPHLDAQLASSEIRFQEQICLKRVSRHRWIEVPWSAVEGTRYDAPFPYANAIVIGMNTARDSGPGR